MRPGSAMDNVLHRSLVDAKLLCQPVYRHACRVLLPSVSHLLISEAGDTMPFTACRGRADTTLPPTAHGIAHVLRDRARIQVVGAYARGVIAVVAHVQAVRNRAVGQAVGYAMRFLQLPVVVANHAVPAWIAERRPEPAVPGLVNLAPEPIFDGNTTSQAGAGQAAVVPAPLEVGREHLKRGAALLADAVYPFLHLAHGIAGAATKLAALGSPPIRELLVALGAGSCNASSVGRHRTHLSKQAAHSYCTTHSA
jgi:hypothetical protein